MTESRFNKPRVAINRVYTRMGDSGQTKLVGGQRVSKGSLRLEAYGTVDELNGFVGMACQAAREQVEPNPELQAMVTCLVRVQHELFNLGATLATLPEDIHPRQPQVTEKDIQRLEQEMDRANQDLEPLLAQEKVTLDIDERNQIIWQITDVLRDEAPALYLWNSESTTGINTDKVSGWKSHARGWIMFTDVSVSE